MEGSSEVDKATCPAEVPTTPKAPEGLANAHLRRGFVPITCKKVTGQFFT